MSLPEPLSVATFSVEHTGADRAVIHADGDLDLSALPLLRTVVDEQLRAGRNLLQLDVTRVEYVGCAALHTLLDRHRACTAAGGALVLVGVGEPLSRVLRITGLDRDLPVASAVVGAQAGTA